MTPLIFRIEPDYHVDYLLTIYVDPTSSSGTVSKFILGNSEPFQLMH